MSAGIIAAGDGSRFKMSGIKIHKPMIPVSGFPLIGHTLKNLERAGFKRVVIIFNESEIECVGWVQNHFKGLEFEFIVKSTQSSFESFFLVGKKLGKGRHLITTVDSICSSRDLLKMAQFPLQPNHNLYLGVTEWVDDEKPLWVQMEEKTNRITALGISSGKSATAGFYNVPDEIFSLKVDQKFSSLRVFLKWLVEKGVPVYGVLLSKVVDVDSPRDVQSAEEMLLSG